MGEFFSFAMPRYVILVALLLALVAITFSASTSKKFRAPTASLFPKQAKVGEAYVEEEDDGLNPEDDDDGEEDDVVGAFDDDYYFDDDDLTRIDDDDDGYDDDNDIVSFPDPTSDYETTSSATVLATGALALVVFTLF